MAKKVFRIVYWILMLFATLASLVVLIVRVDEGLLIGWNVMWIPITAMNCFILTARTREWWLGR